MKLLARSQCRYEFTLFAPTRKTPLTGRLVTRDDGYFDYEAAFSAWDDAVPLDIDVPLRPTQVLEDLAKDSCQLMFPWVPSHGRTQRPRDPSTKAFRGRAFHPALLRPALIQLGSPEAVRFRKPMAPVFQYAEACAIAVNERICAYVDPISDTIRGDGERYGEVLDDTYAWNATLGMDMTAGDASVPVFERYLGMKLTRFATECAGTHPVCARRTATNQAMMVRKDALAFCQWALASQMAKLKTMTGEALESLPDSDATPDQDFGTVGGQDRGMYGCSSVAFGAQISRVDHSPPYTNGDNVQHQIANIDGGSSDETRPFMEEMITALGVSGAENLLAVRKSDGKVWISTMFRRAPEGPKHPKDWAKPGPTKEYIAKMAVKLGVSQNSLIDKDGVSPFDPNVRGWWVHFKLLVDAARSISVDVRIICDEVVETVFMRRAADKDAHAAASAAQVLGVPLPGSGGIAGLAISAAERTVAAEYSRDTAHASFRRARANHRATKASLSSTIAENKRLTKAAVSTNRRLGKLEHEAHELRLARDRAVDTTQKQADMIQRLQQQLDEANARARQGE